MSLFSRKPIVEKLVVGNTVENWIDIPGNDGMTPEENAEFKKVLRGLADLVERGVIGNTTPAPAYVPVMNAEDAEAEARSRFDRRMKGEYVPPAFGAVREAEDRLAVEMISKVGEIKKFDADLKTKHGLRFVD